MANLKNLREDSMDVVQNFFFSVFILRHFKEDMVSGEGFSVFRTIYCPVDPIFMMIVIKRLGWTRGDNMGVPLIMFLLGSKISFLAKAKFLGFM